MPCDEFNVLYVLVKGSTSDHPSATRSFKGIAHDIVEWVDAIRESGLCMTTVRTVRLSEHIRAALKGESGGPIRAIRPSHRGEPCLRVFDEIVHIAQQPRLASERMRAINAILIESSRQKHIASPVLECPAQLTWRLIRDGKPSPERALAERTCEFKGSRKDARTGLMRELRLMSDRTAPTGVKMVIFASNSQREYVDAVCGRDEPAWLPAVPRLCLREFCNRENLTAGTSVTPSRLRTADMDVFVGVATEAGVPRLICELSDICRMSVQRVIDHGVRARCMSLLGGLDGRHRSDSVEPVDVQGGMVIEPEVAMVEKPICVMDFASLYPSLIVSRRIGEGMRVPDTVERLMDLRSRSDDRSLSRACKLMANSFYGQLASRTSAIYDPAVAGAITEAGRESLRGLAQAVADHGGQVLYGDTDSAMAVFPSATSPQTARDVCQEFVDDFNASLPRPMRLCLQSVFRPCIFLSKKRYIARDGSGALISVGTPNIRSDWPPILRKLYAEVACALLDRAPDEDALRRLLSECVERITGCVDVNLFVATRKIANPESNSRHAELARVESFREDGLRYVSGDSIEFVVCVCGGSGSPTDGAGKERWCSPDHTPESARVSTGAYKSMFLTHVSALLNAACGQGVASRCVTSATAQDRAVPTTLFRDDRQE